MHTSDAASQPTPTVFGLDNVALDLRPAGLGTRSLALMIDAVLLMITAVIWGVLMATLASFSGLSTAWVISLASIGYFLLQWGYFSAFEILADGKTPGKMVLSLQTVSHLGGRPSVGAIVIRNLLRSVDYAFGVFFMALDPRSRRLGDMVASTLVVHRASLGPAESFHMGRVPSGWSTEEVLLVESFLRRAARMEPEIASDLAGRLLSWIEREDPGFVAEGPPASATHSTRPEVPYEVHRLCALLAVETFPDSTA